MFWKYSHLIAGIWAVYVFRVSLAFILHFLKFSLKLKEGWKGSKVIMKCDILYRLSSSRLYHCYTHYLVTVTTWCKLAFLFELDRVARRHRKYKETTIIDNNITTA